MLPGFRFLVAAIALSVSMLVFGLGAAALLRAAHERFVSVPLMRAPPGPMFARHTETPAPTLSLLRVDAAVSEPTPPDLQASLATQSREPAPLPGTAPVEAAASAPATTLAESETAVVPVINASATSQPAPTDAQPAEPIKSESTKSESTKSEPPHPEAPTQIAAIAEPSSPTVAEPQRVETAPSVPASVDLDTLAMVAEPAPAEIVEPSAMTAPVLNAPLPSPRPARASPRTASLGETATIAETEAPKQVVRKRARAKRVVQRRRPVARAARPAQAATQNPFGG